jgi:hypothetical protein
MSEVRLFNTPSEAQERADVPATCRPVFLVILLQWASPLGVGVVFIVARQAKDVAQLVVVNGGDDAGGRSR